MKKCYIIGKCYKLQEQIKNQILEYNKNEDVKDMPYLKKSTEIDILDELYVEGI